MGTYRAFEAQNEKNSAKARQTYLGEIRKLRVQPGGPGKLAVSLVERYSDPEFARRDLNVALTMLPDGSLGAGVYGGVFTKDQLNFTRAIYFSAKSAPAVDRPFGQQMRAYARAQLLVFGPGGRGVCAPFFCG